MSRKTDASGVVTLDGLPAGSSVRLEVTDPRFARLDYTDNVQIGLGPDAAVKADPASPGRFDLRYGDLRDERQAGRRRGDRRTIAGYRRRPRLGPGGH